MKLPRARSAPNQCRFSHHLFHLSQSVQEYTHIQSNMPLSIKKRQIDSASILYSVFRWWKIHAPLLLQRWLSPIQCAPRGNSISIHFHLVREKGRRRKHIGGIKCNPFSQGKARTISNLHFASWACL
jgi:hypothetical protein